MTGTAAAPTEDEIDAVLVRTWPVLIKLAYPVTFGTETITELEFRRGTLGDLKGILQVGEVPPLDKLLLLASRLCGQPTKVIEMLDPDDSGEVLEIVLVFIGRCQRGGKKPSR